MLDGKGTCKVLVVGSQVPDKGSVAFSPASRTGSLLERAIRRIGASREMFWLCEVEDGQEVSRYIENLRPQAILALGGDMTAALTGLSGPKLAIKQLTGYVLPAHHVGWPPVIPCFEPLFLRQGHMALFGVLMRCLRLAMQVAKEQRQPLSPPIDNPPPGYITHPTEQDALAFEQEASTTKGYLAYDIETYYSTEEDAAEESIVFGRNDLRSIQFSTHAGSGIFLPWREPFKDVAQRILATSIPKINWNGWKFDNPLLRDYGCPINGQNIDLMWMWHHAQPDLPRNLQFAAAMQGSRIYSPTHSWPWPWKHLSGVNDQFYGIVDVDVLQWMVSYALN